MKYKKKQKRKWKNLIKNKIFQWNEYKYDTESGKCFEVFYDYDLDKISKKIKKYEKYIGRLSGYQRSYEKDYRTGEKTYGYESTESINENLMYISDRFVCAFRLTWLKEIPDKIESLSAGS
jgi:hypothetical protein